MRRRPSGIHPRLRLVDDFPLVNNKAKTLPVTNHAGLTGLPDPSAFFAIFDVYVKDKAGKLFNNDDED